jgi:hypothetical protein
VEESTEATEDYRTPSGLRDLLGSVLVDLRHDKISTKQANTIARVGNAILSSYRVEILLRKETNV